MPYLTLIGERRSYGNLQLIHNLAIFAAFNRAGETRCTDQCEMWHENAHLRFTIACQISPDQWMGWVSEPQIFQNRTNLRFLAPQTCHSAVMQVKPGTDEDSIGSLFHTISLPLAVFPLFTTFNFAFSCNIPLYREDISPTTDSLWPPCIADAVIIFSSCGFFFFVLFFLA